MADSRVGFTRYVMGAGGDVSTFTSNEQITSEAIRVALFKAPFKDGIPNKYELLDNAYRASGGFETGDYLIPHPRESVDKYSRRKSLAYYTNYVKPVVDSTVNPIFKTAPNRQGGDSLYNKFINDVDGNNTSLTRFMKKAAIRAKLHGVEFIVIDMEQIDDTEILTKQDVLEKRIYPYLYLVSPKQITDWAVDKFGRITYIEYELTNVVVDEDGNKSINTETYKWTTDYCIKSANDGTQKIVNSINTIPIVPIYGAINDADNLIPQSDIYAIARTNLAIFQAASEYRERQRNQCFSILTFPINGKEDDYESGADFIKYGTNDCLIYDGNSSSYPQFITPPADPSNTLLAEIEFMIKEIYRMANMQMTTGVNQYNVSGIAKKWDNQQLYQTISDLAQNLQQAEYLITKIFSQYTNENNENVSIVYNQEFGIVDATEVLNQATQALTLNISPEFNVKIKEQVIRATLTDVDQNIVEDVIENLKAQPTASAPLLDGQGKIVQQPSN